MPTNVNLLKESNSGPTTPNSMHLEVTMCMHACSLACSSPEESDTAGKQTSLFSLSGSLCSKSTCCRHLSRKRVPKCGGGLFLFCGVVVLFCFFKSSPYILNRLQGFDCSSWAATGTEVNVEAFFQHTVIVSDFPLIIQEPTARII